MEKEQNCCEILPVAKDFKFCLGQMVDLRISDEWGEVLARSQHLNGENQYFIHYQAANKCATERWYGESQLLAAEDDRSPGCPVFGCTELPPGAVVETDLDSDVVGKKAPHDDVITISIQLNTTPALKQLDALKNAIDEALQGIGLKRAI